MAAPVVNVSLFRADLGVWQRVSATVDMESNLEITEAIESPAETNSFVAPDVQIKVHVGSASEFQFYWFDSMTPIDTNWEVDISRDSVTIFRGFVLPNTLQFDDVEKWASFTAVGTGGRLARTSAEISALKRATGTGWVVKTASGDATSAVVTIEKASGAQATCEFVSGDRLSFTTSGGDVGEADVSSVAPVGIVSPYAEWALVLKGLPQKYVAGTTIDLLTPYLRNVPLKTAVDALYGAAGITPTIEDETYLVSPIAGASAPFASVPSYVGLSGTPLAVAPNVSRLPNTGQYWPTVGTTNGTWRQIDSPLGLWQQEDFAPTTGASWPVDWTPQGTGTYMMYGPRFTQAQTNATTEEVTYTWWAYDYRSSAVTPTWYYRWGLELKTSYLNGGPGALFSWSYQILSEISSNGWTWMQNGGPYAATAGTTDTPLYGEVAKTCGCEIFADRVIFSAPKIGSGPEIEYTISQLDIATLALALDVFPYHGVVFAPSQSILGVYSIDTMRGNVPTAYFFQRSGAGYVYYGSAPCPAGLVPFSIKRNPGDNYYYALSATEEEGVRLLSFVGTVLGERAGWTPSVLFPPTPLYLVNNIDLAVVKTSEYTGSGPYPMFGIFGNQLWWIAFSYAGIVAYANVEGMSCGEALAQLATLVDGYFYVDASETSWFRTRSTSSARTIATGTSFVSTRIDDAGCLSLRRASVWYKNYQHILVENADDESIEGESGDVNFRDTEQGLVVESRFVSPDSFAQALAENLLSYLGRSLTVLDVEHEMDGRRYEVGRTFTASVGGVVKTFQIMEATIRPIGGTVRVQGVEM